MAAYHKSINCNPLTPLLPFVADLLYNLFLQLTRYWLTQRVARSVCRSRVSCCTVRVNFSRIRTMGLLRLGGGWGLGLGQGQILQWWFSWGRWPTGQVLHSSCRDSEQGAQKPSINAGVCQCAGWPTTDGSQACRGGQWLLTSGQSTRWPLHAAQLVNHPLDSATQADSRFH